MLIAPTTTNTKHRAISPNYQNHMVIAFTIPDTLFIKHYREWCDRFGLECETYEQYILATLVDTDLMRLTDDCPAEHMKAFMDNQLEKLGNRQTQFITLIKERDLNLIKRRHCAFTKKYDTQLTFNQFLLLTLVNA